MHGAAFRNSRRTLGATNQLQAPSPRTQGEAKYGASRLIRFGPGAINLISGQTNGFDATAGTLTTSHEVPDGGGDYTLVGDADPIDDVCSGPFDRVRMKGKNIGADGAATRP